MDIHFQLKRIRQLSGLTQKQLAEKSGNTQAQVCNAESGKDCNMSTMRGMLWALGYDLVAVPIEKAEGGK